MARLICVVLAVLCLTGCNDDIRPMVRLGTGEYDGQYSVRVALWQRVERVRALLSVVNDRVNQEIASRSELVDRWPSSVRARLISAGDCEDKAIAKAAILWDDFGLDPKKLTLAIGQVFIRGTWRGHCVALYWDHPEDPLVLDNGAVVNYVVRLHQVRRYLRLEVAFNRSDSWPVALY